VFVYVCVFAWKTLRTAQGMKVRFVCVCLKIRFVCVCLKVRFCMCLFVCLFVCLFD
jgi:hypothetical protein